MSKNKKKKQNNPMEVYMQIMDAKTEEKHMLRVPSNFKNVLESLIKKDENKDYHNSPDILQLFCEVFTGFDKNTKNEFEIILNSKIAKTESVADLLTLAYQMYKYYRLKGVDNHEKLGQFHILASRRNSPDDWIAKSNFEDASAVGKKVKAFEGGKFYKNNYIGVYHCFLEEQTDD